MPNILRNTSCILVLVAILIGLGCTVKNPATAENGNPILENLSAPSVVYLLSPTTYPVSVNATDPQGWTDIQAVYLEIRRAGESDPVFSDVLQDNGTDGDLIPKDGSFFRLIDAAFANGQEGAYQISVYAVDQSEAMSGILTSDMAVQNTIMNEPPQVFNPVVPDTLDQVTLDDVFLSVEVEDPQGLTDIDSVVFQIFPPWNPVHSYESLFRDNGLSGDLVEDDGIFSFRGSFTGILRIGGRYAMRIYAQDHGGLTSQTITVPFFVISDNDPPVLSDLEMPDTVSRSTVGSFVISVRVTDPQGPDDIRKVYFNMTKPDGSPSASNPVPMFDDGSYGDETPGDSIYTLGVSITAQNDTGVYIFEFYAEDWSGALSDVLTFNLTVVE